MTNEIEKVINELNDSCHELIGKDYEIDLRTGDFCKIEGNFNIFELRKIARTMERIKGLRDWARKDWRD